MEEDDHFGPGMPTVEEWLGAHASCLSRTSDRGAGEHMQTDRFKAGGEWRGDSHKDMPKLRFCLAEARREEDREFLKGEDLDSSESKSRWEWYRGPKPNVGSSDMHTGARDYSRCAYAICKL